MQWRCAARQSWPVLSQKFANACFLGLFLLFSHVDFMFCYCVLFDEAVASWENFSCVFCCISLLIVSKVGVVCLFWSVVPFFANRSAVSFPCIPMCEGTHWKAIVLPCLLRSFIVLLGSFTVWIVACLFQATVWMADLESTRRTAFLKAVGLRSSCCSALAIAVISPSKLVLLLPTEM